MVALNLTKHDARLLVVAFQQLRLTLFDPGSYVETFFWSAVVWLSFCCVYSIVPSNAIRFIPVPLD